VGEISLKTGNNALNGEEMVKIGWFEVFAGKKRRSYAKFLSANQLGKK
jgi:hypothetical protein